MFGLFSKKKAQIVSPVDGQVIELAQVPDEVFSKRMVGDGVAILPTSDIIKAPVDGIINMIFKTNHAFTIATNEGVEILVHVGIDTIELRGEGFLRLVQEKAKVKAGTPVLKVDFDLIKSKGKHTATPVLIATMDRISGMNVKSGVDVQGGCDEIISYTAK